MRTLFTTRLSTPTRGVLIAIWLFPALTLWLGISYLGPTERLQSASFTAAREVMPMHAWGALFLTLAVIKVVCIKRGTVRGYVLAMCAGMGLYGCWGVLFLGSVFADPHASLGGPAWCFVWVGMHVAVLATMTEGR